MKRLLIAAAFCLLSSSAFGWNLKDHRNMASLALESVAEEWGLNEACPIRPLELFLDKLKPIRPEIADAWQFSFYLKINPKIDLSAQTSLRFPEGTPRGNTLTPLEILSLYATDADDGRDQDLFLRDDQGHPRPMFPDQKWFGSVQGPNSQAFRHIEKPPFRLSHPLTTFGIPLRSLGEASQRTEIYFQLSQLAFALGEDYWGWRFLAGGLHYLEDLHQPYHAGQITPLLLRKGLKVLLSWGRSEKGFIGSFAHVISNSHRFFETYIDRAESFDPDLKEHAYKSLLGTDALSAPLSARDLAEKARDDSNSYFAPLAEAVGKLTGESLYERQEFFSDGDRGTDNSDPKDFVLEGFASEDANRKIFEIVENRFAAAGRSIRTYIRLAIDRRKISENPQSILATLDQLLGPTIKESNVEGDAEE